MLNDNTLILCHIEALSAWDKVEESGKRVKSFTRIVQSLKETFTDFAQDNISYKQNGI